MLRNRNSFLLIIVILLFVLYGCNDKMKSNIKVNTLGTKSVEAQSNNIDLSQSNNVNSPTNIKVDTVTDEKGTNEAPINVIIAKRVQVNSQLPEYTIKINAIMDEGDYSVSYKANKVEVYNNNELLQHMEFAGIELKKEASEDGQFDILIADVDFDGNKDVLLREDTAFDNNYGVCLLWDSEKFSFIENKDIEDILNPTFDSTNQIIISNPTYELSRTLNTKIYKFINNKVVQIKNIESRISDDEETVHYTISELEGNDMKVTNEHDEPNIIEKEVNQSINSLLSDITFKVIGKKKISGYEEQIYYSISKIEIYKDKQLIQVLDVDETRTLNGNNYGFIIEDMNFDGYDDLRLQQFTPPGPNIPYYYWVWDTSSSMFIRDKELEIVTSPVVDKNNKVITSFVRASAADHIDLTYAYVNGELTLIKSYEFLGDVVDGKIINHYITSKLIDGKMEVVEEYIQDSGEAIKN